tara:strand:- start:1370 stop:1870 length:501 start_codon:yes stop_codon:yes gene_type:complete
MNSINNPNLFDDETSREIDDIKRKFPNNQKKSSIIESLLILQKKNNGYLTKEIMISLASYLKVEEIDIYEVVTFYSMFNIKPVGRNIISVCTNVSCMIRNSDKILEHIENKLNIKVGETTKDKKFYLKNEIECLAACNGAPMMQVNHKNYENLTIEQVDKILGECE